jgi:hypothetical protein
MMEQALAQSPTTQGILPKDSSTTATAIAGAENRTNERTGYKALTYENTLLCDQYWMIQQLSWQYAEEETLINLLGDKAPDFEPDGDYFYKPVSQSIETEYSKNTKIKNLLTALQTVAQVPNEKTAQMINYIMYKFFTLMGDEFDPIAKILLNPNDPNTATGGVGNTQNPNASPVSNQNGVPISSAEANTRENALG